MAGWYANLPRRFTRAAECLQRGAWTLPDARSQVEDRTFEIPEFLATTANGRRSKGADNVRQRTRRWARSRSGLRALLGVGAVLLALIALSAIAWAGVNVENKSMSADQNGEEKDQFSTADDIYARPFSEMQPEDSGRSAVLAAAEEQPDNSAFPVTYCVTADRDWDMSTAADEGGLGALEADTGIPEFSYAWAESQHREITNQTSCVTVTEATSNTPTLLWEHPLTAGRYDIALFFHDGGGEYPVYVDKKMPETTGSAALLESADEENGSGTPGFMVSQATVGGRTLSPGKAELIAPWGGVGLLLAAGLVLTITFHRRRR